jgi:hypothetical protein
MNTDLVIGALALGYGLFTLTARFALPDSSLFRKLGLMKERFGPVAGLALHWAAYTVAPLALGSVKLAQAVLPVLGR